MNVPALKGLSDRLASLLADPQPGLSMWTTAVERVLMELSMPVLAGLRTSDRPGEKIAFPPSGPPREGEGGRGDAGANVAPGPGEGFAPAVGQADAAPRRVAPCAADAAGATEAGKDGAARRVPPVTASDAEGGTETSPGRRSTPTRASARERIALGIERARATLARRAREGERPLPEPTGRGLAIEIAFVPTVMAMGESWGYTTGRVLLPGQGGKVLCTVTMLETEHEDRELVQGIARRVCEAAVEAFKT